MKEGGEGGNAKCEQRTSREKQWYQKQQHSTPNQIDARTHHLDIATFFYIFLPHAALAFLLLLFVRFDDALEKLGVETNHDKRVRLKETVTSVSDHSAAKLFIVSLFYAALALVLPAFFRFDILAKLGDNANQDKKGV
jgi:hypothetical protein